MYAFTAARNSAILSIKQWISAMQHKQSQISDCISYTCTWVIVIRDTHFTDLRVFLSSNNDVRNALHRVFIDGIATQDVSPIYKYDTLQSGGKTIIKRKRLDSMEWTTIGKPQHGLMV